MSGSRSERAGGIDDGTPEEKLAPAVGSVVPAIAWWWWLAWVTALLAAAASAVGLLAPGRIYGKETVALFDAATAQDIVTLLVVVPLLVLLVLRVRQGSLAAFLCLPGVLGSRFTIM